MPATVNTLVATATHRNFDIVVTGWEEETLTPGNELRDNFLAGRHEAAIQTFIAADQKRRIGASVPT